MTRPAPRVVAELDRDLAAAWPSHLTPGRLEALLVSAVHARRLAECARALLESSQVELDGGGVAILRSALAACEQIRSETVVEQARMAELLTAAGIGARTTAPDAPSHMQDHRFEVSVDSVDVDRALSVAEADGYARWAPMAGGAWESYRRTHSTVLLIKADAVTTRVILRWAPNPAPSRVRSWIRPTLIDYGLVALPTPLWPAYHLLRPVRLVLDRLKGSRRPTAWPYLGTPTGLLEPLLAFAGVTSRDRIVDLGCGDGRILIHAAHSKGCRGLGIEQDPTYADLARRRSAAAAVGDRVRIEVGDARRADLGEATVVFLFLPPDAVRRLVPDLLGRLKPGARILSHEQQPRTGGPAPGRSSPVFGPNAVTVAHLWTVD
jgi:SAM-dependent methyltransferase